MRVKLLVDNRVNFAKGSEVEVDEREGVRLLSLGFAEKVAEEVKPEKVAVEVKPEESEKKAEKKAGRPKKEK